MNKLESVTIDCPYCGKIINILVDCSEAEQSYIEDCHVCCRPISLKIVIDEELKIPIVIASHENEV